MLNNGGRFVNYFSRHTVTHIVCTNLPDSKMKNLMYISGGQRKGASEFLLVCFGLDYNDHIAV